MITAAFLALLANSAYLAAFAVPSLFYFANVALHFVMGIALAVIALRRVVRSPSALTATGWSAAVVLGAGTLTGLVVAVVGATRPNRWLLQAHIVLMVAGTALALVAIVRAARGWAGPRARRLALLSPAIAVALLGLAAGGKLLSDRSERLRYRIANPLVPPLKMEAEGGGPDRPFFPSSAETTSGRIIPADFFTTSAACGRCHKDVYEQWSSSMHHFSSFNNQWYRKSIEYMQDVAGIRPSKWCAGCHDHAVFFNGRFERPIKEQIETPEAQAGLACTSCHSIVHVGSSMGQGDFTIEYPPLHDLAASESPVLQRLHDTLIYLAPEPHRNTFLKPFHREQTAEFCSSCHKVHLDVPVNGYRWFRGFDDYDNWQAPGGSGQRARSFYYPAKPQRCTDCHMPLVASTDPAAKHGMVRSHRFPGANTALPFVNHDDVQLRAVQDFLRDGQVSIDVFGIARTPETGPADERERPAGPSLASTFAVGEESGELGPA